MNKYDLSWHKADIAEEFLEYQQANGVIEKWSEISDIVYTYTRARWSGHTTLAFPLSRKHIMLGAIYMFPKYSLRWLFFFTAGKLVKSEKTIREVRNPKKINKLDEIATQYGVDKVRFRFICKKLLRYWLLLK